ncbi:MAG: hypothetical protein A3E80_00340 [Chlamydiae bacterium RIFCSPHIGHO2_12_FULL_49_9]|nr:MAG: hypothetical protein A3E80_00340 [Chlamydiae bacterium RIFCSPHIGHO2_12_FULL_49_9]
MMERVIRFFREGLWNFPLEREVGLRYFWFKWLRLLTLAIKNFYLHRCNLSASSLTYYTLMSIVPLFAIAFAVAQGLGYRDPLQEGLLQNFRDQKAVLVEVFSFAEKLIEESKRGLVAGVGLVVLFWSVGLLFSSMESSFNAIWDVKMRSWKQMAHDYFALILLGPFLFIASSSLIVFAISGLEETIRLLFGTSWNFSVFLFFLHLLPYGISWILYSFIYLFVPNTKVRVSSALWGGFLAGSLHVGAQWSYIHFQGVVNRFGSVYGSMAALPLFLIALQVSWFLLLFGAEIAHAHQTFQEHEFEPAASRISLQYKRVLSLWFLKLSLMREKPLSAENLAKERMIPKALSLPILKELEAAKLLFLTKEGYLSAPSLKSMRISDVLSAIDQIGISELSFIDPENLRPFTEVLDHFRASFESSPQNKRLAHVSDSI